MNTQFTDKILEYYETLQFDGNLLNCLPRKYFIVYNMIANNKDIDSRFLLSKPILGAHTVQGLSVNIKQQLKTFLTQIANNEITRNENS